jgi:hypothetical protein
VEVVVSQLHHSPAAQLVLALMKVELDGIFIVAAELRFVSISIF